MNPFSSKEKTSQIVQGKLLSTYFHFNIDQKRYNTLLQDLKNNNLKGLYAYPNTANGVIDIINNYRAEPAAGPSVRHNTRISSVVHFEQGQGTSLTELCAMTPVAGSNGQTIEQYTRYNCGRRGHNIPFCSKYRRTCNGEFQI